MLRRHYTRKALGVRLLLRRQGMGRWLAPTYAERSVKEVLERLEALKKVLEKPFPKKEEIENLVPPSAKLRSLYVEMLDELEEVPEDETSRKVFIRMASGPKYEAYRERADRLLKHLDFLTDHLEEIRAGSEILEVCRVRG